MRTANLLVVVALVLAGCGARPKPPVSKGSAAASEPAAPVLTRRALNAVIDAGLGASLQHLTLADLPVTRGGQVYGYQVLGHDDAPFWLLFDVRPGDVLVALNGGSLATPDDAMSSFEALRGAGEVRLRIERAGRVMDLAKPVVDLPPK